MLNLMVKFNEGKKQKAVIHDQHSCLLMSGYSEIVCECEGNEWRFFHYNSRRSVAEVVDTWASRSTQERAISR